MEEATEKKGEIQYQASITRIQQRGMERMGLMASWAWLDDPKRLVFTLARYKFVAKMLQGRKHVLEAGCADAFGTRIVRQAVGALTAVDFDIDFVNSARSIMAPEWPYAVLCHDLLEGPVPGSFDGLYSMDVIEHIPAEKEDEFLRNLLEPLDGNGVALIGSPSLESQAWASEQSKIGHINCKTQDQLRETLSRHFHNVFIFSMNDEMVHTGFGAMSHYNMALCCGKKRQA